MKFYFFTKGDETVPSSRFRGYFLADALRQLGHTVIVEPVIPPPSDGFFTREGFRQAVSYFRMLRAVKSSEIIYLQRTIYNKFFFAALMLARVLYGKKYIFDIDDATYLHSPLKTNIIIRFAAAITCGGEEIWSWVVRRNPKAHVFYNALPNIYFEHAPQPQNAPTIGWIGNGPAHFENLALLADHLSSLVASGVTFSFKLVGAVGDSRVHRLFAGIPGLLLEIVDEIDWKNPMESIQMLDSFQIGLMPLKDTTWNQAKYMKTVEYMARGVIPVASNVGENARIIQNGINGYVVTNDWSERLKTLLTDSDQRLYMREQALKTAREKFSMTKRAQEFLALANELHDHE